MSDDTTNDETTNASKGGRARAESLSPEQRSEIARQAAAARWAAGLPGATHGGTLNLGGLELPCFVLETNQRLLSQSGMVAALGMKRGSNPALGSDRLANFAAGKRISPFISERLSGAIEKPVRFRMPNTPVVAYGYDATILADVCEAVLAMRRAGVMQTQQENIAIRCEILMAAFSRVGIVALVDEATGYQADRARDGLARILEKFIAKELQRWVKTFPADFYKEMFRLRRWAFPPAEGNSTARPPLVGKLTNNLVYRRLAPGVLEDLQRITPRDDNGRLRHKLHQRLTEDVGHPRLREHIAQLIALMRAADDWGMFMKMLDRALPQFGKNYELQLPRVT